MRTIRSAGEHEIEIKKSRFRCALARVSTAEEARAFVQQRRREHHSARHHCSAYVLGAAGETQKSSDDGEPAGTAGVPMLEVLRRHEVTDVVAVVTRYFGGVLLGAGGLVRAYSGAVSAALDALGLVERRPMRVVSTVVDYSLAGRLENELRSSCYPVADVHYGVDVRFDVQVPEGDVPAFEVWLAEATGGAATGTVGELTHVEVEP